MRRLFCVGYSFFLLSLFTFFPYRVRLSSLNKDFCPSRKEVELCLLACVLITLFMLSLFAIHSRRWCAQHHISLNTSYSLCVCVCVFVCLCVFAFIYPNAGDVCVVCARIAKCVCNDLVSLSIATEKSSCVCDADAAVGGNNGSSSSSNTSGGSISTKRIVYHSLRLNTTILLQYFPTGQQYDDDDDDDDGSKKNSRPFFNRKT